jgi:hypothetical protein
MDQSYSSHGIQIRLNEQGRVSKELEDQEIKTQVVFKEIGTLSGTSSFAHLIFDIDLGSVDGLFEGFDMALRNQDDVIEKLGLSNQPLIKIVHEEGAAKKVRNSKERWENFRAMTFKTANEDRLHPNTNRATITDRKSVV